MKVGNLKFYRFCSRANFVVGPNPCACMGASICMYTLCGGILIYLAASMDAGIVKALVWTLVGLNTLVFCCLGLSNPGVPP